MQIITKVFYSTFFLVPKKSGDLRVVINLRLLNQYLKTTFQDGHYENSPKSSKERRLGFYYQQRCIFSHLDSSKSQKMSSLLHKRESLSIQSISFWSKNFTKSFHKGGSSSCSLFENAEHKTSSVLGRQVGTKCNQRNASQRQEQNEYLIFFLD